MNVPLLIMFLSLTLCVERATAADIWFKNPNEPLRPGEAAFSEHLRRGPIKPHYRTASVKARELLAQGQQIKGYIFGIGVPDKGSTRIVEVIRKLSLTVEGKTIEVPMIGLRDLARLKLPESLTVFRADKAIIIEVYGPDGSEGYEVQFVCDGTRFLYRLVRYQQGPFLAKYPNPLRLDF
jgi:hypothetical protein